MDDCLCVAGGVEVMSKRGKLGVQFLVVVNPSVIDCPNGFVLVMNGLVSCLEVNNVQPPYAEPDVPFNKRTSLVRATVVEGLAHLLQQAPFHGSFFVKSYYTTDSAHGLRPLQNFCLYYNVGAGFKPTPPPSPLMGGGEGGGGYQNDAYILFPL